MHTQCLAANNASITYAAKLLQQGQVVAIPTETVYGLAASALCGEAVRRVFAAKGRPQDNPLIAHVADMDMLEGLVATVNEDAKKLAAAFWPGPLTMVLPRGKAVAGEVCAGLDSVGVRMPSHPAALAVIRAAGSPLAAPSANLSGSPSPTSAAHVMQDMDGRIPLVLDGGVCQVGVESTVVSLTGAPVVLRPGFITPAQLSGALGKEVAVADAVLRPLESGEAAASPGMKYRHYAPKAKITLVEGDFAAFVAYVERNAAKGAFALCTEEEQACLPVPCVTFGHKGDEASQAAQLFDALRRLDEAGAQTVYARLPRAEGVGLAVFNRLLRAAAFRVVKA